MESQHEQGETLVRSDGVDLQLAKQYVTFVVGKMLFGVNLEEVQEIIRYQPLTPVPLAPKIVKGIVNLRGQIITAIDMRAVLNLGEFEEDSTPMNVIIKSGRDTMSLLVDKIGDVIDVDANSFEPTPETISENIKRIIDGVFKLDKQLLFILKAVSLTEQEDD